MDIFYINLDKDIERRTSMERQLKSLGLRYQRIPAVYGRELSEEVLLECYSRRKALRCQSRELTFAEIGCAMSHIHVYRKIIEQKLPYALILEDDVLIPENFADAVGAYNAVIQADRPEILLLSPAEADWRQPDQIRKSGICRAVPFSKGYLASSYIVTHLAAQSLLHELYPVSIVADSWERLSTFKVVDVLVLSPFLIKQEQDKFGSSTTADYRPFSNVGEKMIYKIRRIRCVVLDFFSAVWRRQYHPYNDVLK